MKRRLLAHDVTNRLVTGTLRLGARPGGWRARRFRDVLRWGPLVARLPNGARLRLFCDREWISSRVFWDGWDGYEPETARYFFSRAQTATSVLDVGANLGYYTLLAALANPSARVLAVEPVPDNLRRLHRNLARNDVANVEVLEAVATATAGVADLRMRVDGFDDRATLAGFADDSRGGPQWRTESVRAVVVDELDLDELELVKIDVEGGELEVLAGMAATVERCRPTIICELLTDENCAWVEERFGALGYRFGWLTDEGLVPAVLPLVRPTPWRNCVLMP